MLARVNGFTDLRRLVDLAPGEARDLAESIERLFAEGLIELVDDPAPSVHDVRLR